MSQNAVDTFLDAIKRDYELREADCGKYSTIKKNAFTRFKVRRYDVRDIGSVSVMTLNMGVMQMATAVLTPVECDIPMISLDYLKMPGIRKCYLEFFDLVLNMDDGYKKLLEKLKEIKKSYGDLKDIALKPSWFDDLMTVEICKDGKKDDEELLFRLINESVSAVMDYAKTLPALTGDKREEKKRLQKSYSDGLIDSGGISTDTFVKSLGAETTRDFFDKVLFRAV